MEHFRPRDACVPASSTCLLPPRPRPSPKPSPPPLRLIRRHLPPKSPLVTPQIPHGSPTFAGRCQKCAPLQPSFQRRTRRARHLASWALDRDRILPDLGFIVYRIIQDSFVRSLPLFRLRTPAVPLLPSHLLSHRTQDDTPLPLLAVAYLCITTHAGLSQVSDQSRTLSMQLALSFSLSRAIAVSSSPYAPLRFPSHAPGHSGAPLLLLSPLPLLLSLVPLLSLRDCEPASDLKNYPSNSHSVELPPALQYLFELFNKPDGLVMNAVQVPMRTVGQALNHCKAYNSTENYKYHPLVLTRQLHLHHFHGFLLSRLTTIRTSYHHSIR